MPEEVLAARVFVILRVAGHTVHSEVQGDGLPSFSIRSQMGRQLSEMDTRIDEFVRLKNQYGWRSD